MTQHDDGQTPSNDLTRLPDPAAAARMLGSYRLLLPLGEGGMGEVWLAEQMQPVHRRVAVKVIKAGMDTRQVARRFAAERQALALMDHPAVAKVFDGGATPEGHPYFVMEYVKGEPITAHCDRGHLTITARVELFIRVCEGVQHAHQKGIIHRDLKPSNILVSLQDDHAAPKIIDFGVAKATAQHLTERTLVTEFGTFVGTPEYMSPEQAEMTGLDIDTRTDVYALGAILYQLLTGALLVEGKSLREKGFDEIRRIIREVDPPRPGARVASMGPAAAGVARQRGTDPVRLTRQLRGDLDWIVMKAVEKDRTRRYGSASDLAADLRRHLDDQPVVARSPGTPYRIGKFIRRHRVGVAAATTLIAFLIVFAATMTFQAGWIARERDRANREAEAAKHVSDFLVGLFQVSDPSEARGNSVTAREVLDRAATTVRSSLENQPTIQSRLLLTIGTVYENLGLYSDANPLLQLALDISRRTSGVESRQSVSALAAIGLLRFRQGRFAEAERHLREAVDGYRRLHGADDAEMLKTIDSLGMSVWGQGRYAEAERLHREALQGLRHVLGDAHVDTLRAMNSLAVALAVQDKDSEAEQYLRDTYEGRRKTLGSDHPDTLVSLANLGNILVKQNKRADAEPLYRTALDIGRRVLGQDHPETLRYLLSLGEVLDVQGKHRDAEVALAEVVERSRRVWPSGHPNLAAGLVLLASALNNQGRYAEAEPLATEALTFLRKNASFGEWPVLAQIGLARAFIGQKRFTEAEPILLEGYAAAKDLPEPREDAVKRLIELYEAWGKPDQAARWRAKFAQ